MKLREFLNIYNRPESRVLIKTPHHELGVSTVKFIIKCCDTQILDKEVTSFGFRPYEDVELMVCIGAY